ncbi:CD59 glycoprotein-like [Haliotis rufescens]|uniref:CD59 glycoprotein-like n=1 Tax=Haliotis rufescens TaxID=6454 RepID=UPI00201ED0FF|nr:CD59 glycoprotein-like [Haliotis rufescens]
MNNGLTLVFVFVCSLHTGTALNCFACASVSESCRLQTTVCPPGKDVCVGLYDRLLPARMFGCSTNKACQQLVQSRSSHGNLFVFCCSRNLCNWHA